MDIGTGMLIILIIIWLIFFVRNILIYKYRARALMITSEKAREAIDNGDDDWRKHYDKYEDSGPYGSMLLALHKWGYNQFYKEI